MMERGKKKETYTMERPSEIEETEDNNQNLYQILSNLEEEWDFIKKRPEETLYRSKMIKALGLLQKENSPRKLMSSLQHHHPRIMSPPPSEEGAWKVRTNDLAVEEVLHERRAAIESGRLRGRRRLFEELAEGVISTDHQENIGGNLVEESDVKSVFSYDNYSDNYEDENWGRKEGLYPSCPHCSCSSSSSQCAKNEESGGLEVATKMAEKRTNVIGCDIVGRGRGRGNRCWVVISIVLVCIVGMIISRNCFGMYYEDEKVIQTPT